MKQPDSTNPQDAGARFRLARQSRRMTLRDLASLSGITASFISQFERGASGASLATLMRMTQALGLSLAELFDEREHHGRVVRKGEHPELHPEEGHSKQLLSQTPLRNFEAYLSELEPGHNTGDVPYVHGDSDELIFVTQGSLELALGDKIFTLHQGDSIEFRSSVPHLLQNKGNTLGAAVFVISPVTSTTRDVTPHSGS